MINTTYIHWGLEKNKRPQAGNRDISKRYYDIPLFVKEKKKLITGNARLDIKADVQMLIHNAHL